MMKLFLDSSKTLANTRTCMILIHREEIGTTKEILPRELELLINHLIEEEDLAVTIRFKEIALVS